MQWAEPGNKTIVFDLVRPHQSQCENDGKPLCTLTTAVYHYCIYSVYILCDTSFDSLYFKAMVQKYGLVCIAWIGGGRWEGVGEGRGGRGKGEGDF